MLSPLLSCLGFRPKRKQYIFSNDSTYKYESKYLDEPKSTERDMNIAADDIVTILLTADKIDHSDPRFQASIDEAMGTCTWTEYIATRILDGLEKAVKNGVVLGNAMKDALEKALEAAVGFAKEHPAFCTLIAIGILAELMPLALAWLGFAEVGIVEGSWAALWQARFAGYAPKGSLFSFLQRLGMTLRWKL